MSRPDQAVLRPGLRVRGTRLGGCGTPRTSDRLSASPAARWRTRRRRKRQRRLRRTRRPRCQLRPWNGSGLLRMAGSRASACLHEATLPTAAWWIRLRLGDGLPGWSQILNKTFYKSSTYNLMTYTYVRGNPKQHPIQPSGMESSHDALGSSREVETPAPMAEDSTAAPAPMAEDSPAAEAAAESGEATVPERRAVHTRLRR